MCFQWKGLSSLARLVQASLLSGIIDDDDGLLCARLFLMSDPAEKIPVVHEMAFPITWLDAEADDDPRHRTNRQVQTEVSTSLRTKTERLLIASCPFAEIPKKIGSDASSISHWCNLSDVRGFDSSCEQASARPDIEVHPEGAHCGWRRGSSCQAK